MPRSGWLAIGAVGAALCGEMLGLRILAGGLAMAAAMMLMLVGAMPGGLRLVMRRQRPPSCARPRPSPSAWPSCRRQRPMPLRCRMAMDRGRRGRRHRRAARGPPDGHDRTRRGGTRPSGLRDAPPLPGRRARPADLRRRTARATPRLAIRRVPRADRRGRHDPRRATSSSNRDPSNRPQRWKPSAGTRRRRSRASCPSPKRGSRPGS